MSGLKLSVVDPPKTSAATCEPGQPACEAARRSRSARRFRNRPGAARRAASRSRSRATRARTGSPSRGRSPAGPADQLSGAHSLLIGELAQHTPTFSAPNSALQKRDRVSVRGLEHRKDGSTAAHLPRFPATTPADTALRDNRKTCGVGREVLPQPPRRSPSPASSPSGVIAVIRAVVAPGSRPADPGQGRSPVIQRAADPWSSSVRGA